MKWRPFLIIWGISCFLRLPAYAQVTQPQLGLRMTERAMTNEQWEDAARGWKEILAQQDWPYQFPRENAMLNLSTCLQRQSRWKDARDLLLPYLAEHTIPSYFTMRSTAHLALIAYEAEGEAGLNRVLDALLSDPAFARDRFASFSQHFQSERGILPLYNGITHYLRTHPACASSPILESLQIELLKQGGEYQEVWRYSQQLLLDQAGTAPAVGLLKSLAEANATLSAPEYAVNLLTAFMPVTPDPNNALPPLLAQYQAQAGQLAERRQQIDRILPATLDDPNGSPEKDKAMLEGLVKEVPGAIYPVSQALAQYLDAHPDHPRRAGLWLAMAGLLASANDHSAAIEFLQPHLPRMAGTPLEITAAAFLAEEHAKRGDFTSAGDLLLQTSKELAEKIDTKMLALRYYRRSGSVAKVTALVNSLGPNPPTKPALIDAVYWLALVATNVTELKSWVELLGSIAPNDTRTAAVRKLLNEMQGE